MFIPFQKHIYSRNRYYPLAYTSSKQIESCGIICRYICGNEVYVLVVKGQIGQKWGFPKGNKLDYETEEECAMRETYEETGLLIELDESAVRVPLTRNVYFICTFYSIFDTQFGTRCMSPSVLEPSEHTETDEIEDVRWMTLSQLQKRRDVCNKDLKTLTSGKDLWFIHKVFDSNHF